MATSYRLLPRLCTYASAPHPRPAFGFVLRRAMSSSTSPTSSSSTTAEATPRIHILGGGNIGTLLAHSLAPYASITLLLRATSLAHFNGLATLHHGDGGTPIISSTATGINAELSDPSGEMIENLIVTTKSYQTVAALLPLVPRLAPRARVLLLQNGAPQAAAVYAHEGIPRALGLRLLAGVISHGVWSVPGTRFDVTLAGRGWLKFGPAALPPAALPSSASKEEEEGEEEGPGGLQVLEKAPLLNARWVANATEVLAVACEKLVMNAAINPLTVLYDASTGNGALLERDDARLHQRRVVDECAAVLTALPELQSLGTGARAEVTGTRAEVTGARAEVTGARVEVNGEGKMGSGGMGVKERFDAKRLHKLVLEINKVTAKNRSSMLQDWKKGVRTEVNEINGWIVQRGRELGIPTPVNEAVVEGVREREREAMAVRAAAARYR